MGGHDDTEVKMRGIQSMAAVAGAVLLAGAASCGSSDASGPEVGGGIPSAIRAAIEGTTVNLAWDPVPGAIAYKVYMAEVGGVTRINVGTLPGNMSHQESATTFHHPPGLLPSSKYYFVVTAVHPGNKESLESCEVTAKLATNEGGAC